MKSLAMAIALALVPLAAGAQQLPPNLPAPVRAAIEENIKVCSGKVELSAGFISEKDINGDGVNDFIVEYGSFVCDGSQSFFCGTGGCTTQVFASLPGGKFVTVLDENVRDLKFSKIKGRPAMVLDLHGSACGKPGVAPCPRTLLWNGKTFAPTK